MCQGTLFKVCRRFTSRPSNSSFGFLNFCVWKKKITKLLNLRSISFIGKRSFFITVLILCNEGAGLVAVSVWELEDLLTLYAPLDSSFSFETVNLGWSILYIKGSLLIISK